MPQRHSEETKAAAQRLCATTAMTYAEIGAELSGVPGPTVSSWARRHGWTRPPDGDPAQADPEGEARRGRRSCSRPACRRTRSRSGSTATSRPRAGSGARCRRRAAADGRRAGASRRLEGRGETRRRAGRVLRPHRTGADARPLRPPEPRDCRRPPRPRRRLGRRQPEISAAGPGAGRRSFPA